MDAPLIDLHKTGVEFAQVCACFRVEEGTSLMAGEKKERKGGSIEGGGAALEA